MLVRSLIDVVTVGIVLTAITFVGGYFMDAKNSSIMAIIDSFRDGDIKYGIILVLAALSNIITWPIQLIYFAATGIKKGVAKLF